MTALRPLGVLALSVMAGCASLPPPENREHVASIPVSSATRLGATALKARPFEQASGFRLMRTGAEALDARLTLIEMAEQSLDLQSGAAFGSGSSRTRSLPPTSRRSTSATSATVVPCLRRAWSSTG